MISDDEEVRPVDDKAEAEAESEAEAEAGTSEAVERPSMPLLDTAPEAKTGGCPSSLFT